MSFFGSHLLHNDVHVVLTGRWFQGPHMSFFEPCLSLRTTRVSFLGRDTNPRTTRVSFFSFYASEERHACRSLVRTPLKNDTCLVVWLGERSSKNVTHVVLWFMPTPLKNDMRAILKEGERVSRGTRLPFLEPCPSQERHACRSLNLALP